MSAFKNFREQRTDTRLSDQTEDGGSGVKEESKFDLLREMGGEREQGRTPPLSPSHRRLLPRSCQADRTSCCSTQRRTRLRSRLASKGKNAVRGKRIRIEGNNDLNNSPLSLTIRREGGRPAGQPGSADAPCHWCHHVRPAGRCSVQVSPSLFLFFSRHKAH